MPPLSLYLNCNMSDNLVVTVSAFYFLRNSIDDPAQNYFCNNMCTYTARGTCVHWPANGFSSDRLVMAIVVPSPRHKAFLHTPNIILLHIIATFVTLLMRVSNGMRKFFCLG